LTEHRFGFGGIGGFAEDVAINGDGGIGGEDEAIVMVGGDCGGFFAAEAGYIVDSGFVGMWCFVNIGPGCNEGKPGFFQ
jgi:hypothetical protein